jgi:hypothetical protein
MITWTAPLHRDVLHPGHRAAAEHTPLRIVPPSGAVTHRAPQDSDGDRLPNAMDPLTALPVERQPGRRGLGRQGSTSGQLPADRDREPRRDTGTSDGKGVRSCDNCPTTANANFSESVGGLGRQGGRRPATTLTRRRRTRIRRTGTNGRQGRCLATTARRRRTANLADGDGERAKGDACDNCPGHRETRTRPDGANSDGRGNVLRLLPGTTANANQADGGPRTARATLRQLPLTTPNPRARLNDRTATALVDACDQRPPAPAVANVDSGGPRRRPATSSGTPAMPVRRIRANDTDADGHLRGVGQLPLPRRSRTRTQADRRLRPDRGRLRPMPRRRTKRRPTGSALLRRRGTTGPTVANEDQARTTRWTRSGTSCDTLPCPGEHRAGERRRRVKTAGDACGSLPARRGHERRSPTRDGPVRRRGQLPAVRETPTRRTPTVTARR